MEPIPLIPQINSLSCPDTEHILREEFQEFLGHQKFPEKIAQNLVEYKSKEREIKSCGAEVLHSYNDLKLNLQELTHAEKVVMTSQAAYLTLEPRQDIQFKFEKIYPSINEDIVQKYSLIQVEDIMPHITERIINCKMQPNEYIFKYACPFTKCSMKQFKIMKCVPCKHNPKNDFKITESQQNDVIQMRRHNKKRNEFIKRKKIKYNFQDKTVFDTIPKNILFSNFEKNVVYEQKLRLRNITSIAQIFQNPIISNKKSKFSVRQNGNVRNLAPGMSAYFTITFLTSDLSEHFEDVLIFHVASSVDITVELSAWRNTPIVQGVIYYKDDQIQTSQKLQKDEVFNYTIDCGSTLYGCRKELKLVIQNIGGPGKFFLLSESEWVSGELNCVSESYVLMLEDFTIHPAYFTLKEDELVEVELTFTPTQYGLCLEKIYVLCDSNTTEELDIIGDCVYFEPYFIKIEMPPCPSSAYKKPTDPENILHLGVVHSNVNIIGTFKVHNTSTIPFDYEWRKNKFCKVGNFIPIDCDNIEIYPDKGTFPPISTTDFKVTVKMKASKFGLYKFVFSLYVLDIMEENLSEGPTYNFGEEYRNSTFEKCMTIQIGKVEVQVHHIPLKVHFYPEVINFPTLFYNTISEKKLIRIVNEGLNPVDCKWIHDENCGCLENSQNQIKIEPEKFNLPENSEFDCFITISPSSYNNIHETFVLSINSGYDTKRVPIHALIEKPHITVSHTFLNFGPAVKRNSKVSAIFYVENETPEQLYWRVHEYRFDFETGQFSEVSAKALDSDCGTLCHKGSGTKLEYILDTAEARKFVSVLVFYTIFNSHAYESSHVILVANILQPVISIRNEDYTDDIFSVEEEYFENESITKNFCIHNDSPLEVKYNWGEPSGFHSCRVNISSDTWNGKLYPWSRRFVQMTVTFLRQGLIRDVYVPLSVEALSEPVYIQICCNVKPPQVVFSIPSVRTEGYIDVLWPTYEIYSEGSVPCEERNVEMEEYILAPDNRYQECGLKSMTDYSIQDEETNIYLQWYPDDIISYLKNIEMPGESSYHYPTDLGTSDEIITVDGSSHKSYPFSNFSTFTHFVEFTNVPCRQMCKKRIEIKNVMDLKTKFSIHVKNFRSKLIHRKKLDQLLINMNWIPDDKYTAQLSDYGIFVSADPECSELKSKDIVSVDIQVYAETWGIYLEELTIEVDKLPVFYLNIFIHIVGLPIEFPMNSNLPEVSDNIIRFGNYSVCSKSETRVIHFRNNCTIPYKIVWHVFVKDIYDCFKSGINVTYDIFDFDNENNSIDCKIRIINYLGKETSMLCDLFEISPREIYIKPNEVKSVKITIHPGFSNDSDNSRVNALLLGHIYLEKEYQIIRNESNFVVRYPEREQIYVKMNLLADIEPGEINLNCIQGARTATISISDFLLGELDIEANIRLMLRNPTKFTKAVGVNIADPFYIVSIRSELGECTAPNQRNIYTCLVPAGNCAQVLIKCEIRTDLLWMLCDVLYKNIMHHLVDCAFSMNNKVKITKSLNVYQQCSKDKQEIPLSVTCNFPCTIVSVENLNFNKVFIGDEKRLTVTLTNKTTTRTWFSAEMHAKMDVFTVTPCNGYLSPSEPHEKSVYLTVIFKPKDVAGYEDTLDIITCISHYKQEIKLCGNGTYDEKYSYKIKA